ncbi:MAG: substrate-binding domain-containing protein [Bacteroidetes bacterium]|nr:substrate-binding domain-containing protein [Bacteroidota bacterium]
MHNLSKISLLLLLLPVLIISSCDYSQIKSKATIGEMSFIADENLEPIMPYLKSEFERINPEAHVSYTLEPTRNAIADLLNKDTKLIMVAGDFNSEDQNYIKQYKLEFQRHEVAIDAIAFIINPDNPVLRLTSTDLQNILTGEYTLWSQIKAQDNDQNEKVAASMKGNENKIKVFIQRPNSGTYQYVKDTILYGKDYVKTSQICSTSTQMLEMVRSNKNAIGISNLCWLSKGNQDSLDTTVRAVRISRIYPNGRQEDFAELHQGLVFTKKYPYTRKIILYTSILDIQLATGWISFLRNKDGQKVFLERGMVPISQPVKVIQLE